MRSEDNRADQVQRGTIRQDDKAGTLTMEQVELYQEFERVIVDPEHHRREIEEEREEELRLSGRRLDQGNVPELPPSRSYTRRILDLIRKPHGQWNREDRALAARVVEDAHFTAMPSARRPHQDRAAMGDRKHKHFSGECDRRLWGLPPRPYLSQP